MNEKFYDLKKEKQDRIINGALKVFSLKGYKHASTDDMIAEAGISKGLLFHYFGNKIGLYEFLFNYCSRFSVVELTSGVRRDEKNYFTIQKQIAYAEAKLERQYPYIALFLDSVLSETAPEALEAIEGTRDMVRNCYTSLLQDADRSIFTEHEAELMDSTITYIKSGLLRSRLSGESFNPDILYREIEEHIDFISAKFTY